MEKLTAKWSICGSGEAIEARQIEITTSRGTLQIGVMDTGFIYILSGGAPGNKLSLHPLYENRVIVKF
jgi:hypothetical protein